MPVQCVRGNLAALPHCFQLRFVIRPASLALHVHVYVHGCRLVPENRATSRIHFEIRSCFGRLHAVNLRRNRFPGMARCDHRRNEQRAPSLALQRGCRTSIQFLIMKDQGEMWSQILRLPFPSGNECQFNGPFSSSAGPENTGLFQILERVRRLILFWPD